MLTQTESRSLHIANENEDVLALPEGLAKAQ
jgi:hypothetical protein